MPKLAHINLALQGGGAHGAFTWGVIDRLLEDETLRFGWISATSAGAVNAVALAAGLAEGSREKAREKMYTIWHAIHKAGVPDLTTLNPFINGMVRASQMSSLATMLSPYEFNPLGFDPLRRLIMDHVDFDQLRAHSPVELMIAATHVASGRARIFRHDEITVETVLASACLPVMHHAVEIEGAAYWDGGFSANPDLVTLASESPVGDTLLVMVSPRVNAGVPTTSRDITNLANRLTFNAPLMRDIEVITSVREAAAGALLAKGRLAPLCRHRFHLVDGGPITGTLDPETTLTPNWDVITYLHGAGRDHAETWLQVARGGVGRLETIDLANYFFPAIEDGIRFRFDGATRKKPVARRSVSGKRAAS